MSENIKICTKCGEELPATTEYFHKSTTGKAGLSSICIKCVKKQNKERYKFNPQSTKDRSKKITVYRRIKKYLNKDRFEVNILNPETNKVKNFGTYDTLEEAKDMLQKKEQEFAIKYPSYYKIEDLPNEKWKDVIGYEGIYMISNLGRVKNIENIKEDLLSIQTTKTGRKRISLSKSDNQKLFSISRLMAINFVCENLHPKTLALIDGKKPTTIKNIDYVTKRDVIIANVSNKTGYTGVTERNGRYRAVIRTGSYHKGTMNNMFLGVFDTAKEAGEAYLKKKFELEFGNMKEVKKIQYDLELGNKKENHG